MESIIKYLEKQEQKKKLKAEFFATLKPALSVEKIKVKKGKIKIYNAKDLKNIIS